MNEYFAVGLIRSFLSLLYSARNNLSGKLPPGIVNLQQLEELDVCEYPYRGGCLLAPHDSFVTRLCQPKIH